MISRSRREKLTSSSTSTRVIPIRNIYYLLCYAWDALTEGNSLEIGSEENTDLVNLFARVVITGTNRLLRKGLDRGYLPLTERIAGVKGKLLLGATIKSIALLNASAWCEFDELDYNVIHNRVIYQTLKNLLVTLGLSTPNCQSIRQLLSRFPQTSEIELSERVFKNIRLGRTNSFYKFLLNVCELLHSGLLPMEGGKTFLFSDFLEDEAKMARLFEKFVRNYFVIEHKALKAASTDINWQLTATTSNSEFLLPKMKTDVTLQLPDRTIIIDTKYYTEALSIREEFNSEKLKASNFYQMHAYITNADSRGLKRPIEGILLYPKTGRELREEFDMPSGGQNVL